MLWQTVWSTFTPFVNGWKGAMGKKETRQEKIERIRREAEDRPIVRELRELAAGRAERDYRRKKALEGG